jgi:hypothetical protein
MASTSVETAFFFTEDVELGRSRSEHMTNRSFRCLVGKGDWGAVPLVNEPDVLASKVAEDWLLCGRDSTKAELKVFTQLIGGEHGQRVAGEG